MATDFRESADRSVLLNLLLVAIDSYGRNFYEPWKDIHDFLHYSPRRENSAARPLNGLRAEKLIELIDDDGSSDPRSRGSLFRLSSRGVAAETAFIRRILPIVRNRPRNVLFPVLPPTIHEDYFRILSHFEVVGALADPDGPSTPEGLRAALGGPLNQRWSLVPCRQG